MLTNPKDYIDYYTNILKKDYNFNDLKINYHGFVGFVMNLFAWTNYDIKEYYDYLFKEGFLATSEESKNLYLHASKHGYNVGYASAASVVGTFSLDLANFPKKLSNVYKREITLPNPLYIKIGDYQFQTDSTYVFVEEGYNGSEKYYCRINSTSDYQRLVSSASTIIKVPIYNLKQYRVIDYTKTITNYDYGTYFPYNVSIGDSEQLYNLIVSVKKVGESTYENYNVSRVKSFDTSISKSVYLTNKSEKLYVIETGNGYHGVWIPNATLNVEVYLTVGSIANSLSQQDGVASGEMTVVDYNSDGVIVDSGSQSFSPTNFIIDCQSVDGGVDIPIDSELKNKITNWVESRDNLINRTDFFNVFENFSKDFDVIFKKSQFIDNNFYLCRTLRDQYTNILYTTNHTYKTLDYQNTDLIKNLTTTVLDDYTGSTLTMCRCYYKIVAVDKFYKATPSPKITATILEDGQAISLTWDVVPEAEYYKIFGRTNKYNQYFVVQKDHVDIDGKVYFIDTGTTGISENCGTRYEEIDQISFPEFMIDLSETITLTDGFYDWNIHDSGRTHITYFIDGKDFWFQPEKITIYKNSTTVDLIKILTPRLDQLVDDSWVIVDAKLYLRLALPFIPSINTVTVTFDKNVTLISPFVYKYNDFFDWFEGYFIYDNIVQYPITNSILPGVTPPISHVNIVFDKNENVTKVFLRSYQTVNGDYAFKIKIDGLNIDYELVTYDENTEEYYYQFDGFLDEDTKITVECYLETVLQFYITTAMFRQTYKIQDQLLLIKYIAEDNRTYISNIPLLSYDRPTSLEDEFEDRDYINTQIFDLTANSNIQKNRIQSDSVQTRFLNTTFCDSYFSNKILVQDYSQNIILPLNVNIRIKYKNSTLDFTKSYADIELLVAKY